MNSRRKLGGCHMIAVRKRGDSFPLTVSSPDLPEGAFPREFTCDGASRGLACSGACRQPAPRSWPLRRSTPTRRAAPSRTGWSTDCRPASPALRRRRPGGRRRQRLRRARLRRPVPAAAPLITTTCDPRAGHPAGPGIRSDKVRPGVTHQRSCAGQRRARRDLPAHLTGSCRCQPSPITGRRTLSTARFHMPHETSPLAR